MNVVGLYIEVKIEGRVKWTEEEEEDVGRCWMILRKRKHQIALCG
jgi:hypothetical protein